MTLEQAARQEAAAELADALILATQDAVIRHGNDPNLSLIVASGLFTVIKLINEKAPGFEALLVRMLAEA